MSIPVLDEAYWIDILGESTPSPNGSPPPAGSASIHAVDPLVFPLAIFAKHHGVIHEAQLLDAHGKVEYAGQVYATPTAAGRAVAVEWKAVDGWMFWSYEDPLTKETRKITTIRKTNKM